MSVDLPSSFNSKFEILFLTRIRFLNISEVDWSYFKIQRIDEIIEYQLNPRDFMYMILFDPPTPLNRTPTHLLIAQETMIQRN